MYASYARYIPAASSLPRAASWDRNNFGLLVDVYFDENGVLYGAVPRGSSSGKLFQEDLDPRSTDEILIGTAKQFTKAVGVCEPLLRDHFFERIRPLVERALAEGDSSHWPLITLNLAGYRTGHAPSGTKTMPWRGAGGGLGGPIEPEPRLLIGLEAEGRTVGGVGAPGSPRQASASRSTESADLVTAPSRRHARAGRAPS